MGTRVRGPRDSQAMGARVWGPRDSQAVGARAQGTSGGHAHAASPRGPTDLRESTGLQDASPACSLRPGGAGEPGRAAGICPGAGQEGPVALLFPLSSWPALSAGRQQVWSSVSGRQVGTVPSKGPPAEQGLGSGAAAGCCPVLPSWHGLGPTDSASAALWPLSRMFHPGAASRLVPRIASVPRAGQLLWLT